MTGRKYPLFGTLFLSTGKRFKGCPFPKKGKKTNQKKEEKKMVTAISTAATGASADFVELLTTVAPLAIGLVVGIAGVRLVIKLFNRGVGK